MWILEGVGDESLRFRVRPGTVKTVGRATRADFIVDRAMVSRLHCRLEAAPEDPAGEAALEVIDLSSTNGTFVNDERVTRKRLSSGDRLRVGRVELKVARATGATPAP
jgi:pSer/pThr/pTyr-binding forkhead associated (FHA) protein